MEKESTMWRLLPDWYLTDKEIKDAGDNMPYYPYRDRQIANCASKKAWDACDKAWREKIEAILKEHHYWGSRR